VIAGQIIGVGILVQQGAGVKRGSKRQNTGMAKVGIFCDCALP